MVQNDAERLTDALMGWMKKDYVGGSSFTPDYDTGEISYEPPGRSLRSFSELSAIDVARDLLFDADGRPNDYYRRFTAAVSLFNYARPNLNSAKADVLVALANLDATQQQALSDYLTGAGNYLSQGPQYFRSLRQAVVVLGAATNTSGFDVQIRALRIRVTVHEGRTVYRLNTVVAPSAARKPCGPVQPPTPRPRQLPVLQPPLPRELLPPPRRRRPVPVPPRARTPTPNP